MRIAVAMALCACTLLSAAPASAEQKSDKEKQQTKAAVLFWSGIGIASANRRAHPGPGAGRIPTQAQRDLDGCTRRGRAAPWRSIDRQRGRGARSGAAVTRLRRAKARHRPAQSLRPPVPPGHAA